MQQRKSFRSSFISVVVPAYKQEKSIVKDILHIEKAVKALGYRYEIIVVVDGLVDHTHEKVLKLQSSKIKVISYKKNEGKGQAVRVGMLAGRGDIIGFIDAGMDIHPSGLSMLLNHMEWYNADIIVGSKLHPVSKVAYPIYRRVLSRGYRLLTRMLFRFKIRDTQVGLKFFKRKVVADVLPRLLVKQYAFDIEMLAVAYSLGYKKIYEAPVEINFKNSNTSITSLALWRVVWGMLWDTAAVFYRLRILHYYKRQKKQKTGISRIHLAPENKYIKSQW